MMMAAQPAPSGGGSDPLSIIGATDLLCWCRSLDDPGTAGQLTDKSGNGNHLLQPTPSLEFTIVTGALNGHDVWRSKGFSNNFYTGVFAINTIHEVWLVTQKRSATSSVYLFDGGTPDEQILYHGGDTVHLTMYAGGLITASAPDGLAWNYITASFNGAASQLIQNGTIVASGNTGTNTATGFTFAARNGGTHGSINDYADVFIINRVTTAAERTALNSYITATHAL